MARPRGQRLHLDEATWTLIGGLSNPWCYASDQFLAKKERCSVRTIQRRIQRGRTVGRLIVSTARVQTNYRDDAGNRLWKSVRRMKAVWKKGWALPRESILARVVLTSAKAETPTLSPALTAKLAASAVLIQAALALQAGGEQVPKAVRSRFGAWRDRNRKQGYDRPVEDSWRIDHILREAEKG